MNFLNSEPPKVLVIDDNSFSRMTTVDLLSIDGYLVLEVESSLDIVDRVAQKRPDLVLLDVIMPQINGFEVCKRLKQDPRTHQIPVIFITVSDDQRSRLQGIEAGGDDFLTKPLDRFTLSARVKSLIQQKQLNEGLDQTEQVLFSIARAIENRYSPENTTSKLTDLVPSFGKYLQLSPQEIDDLIFAIYLHDIGTVGIPDAILLKKGKLTAQERELINQHVLIGEKICQPLQSKRGVLPIIRHHHERWDGSGYPDGLIGNEIPLLAQIFQILDIYNALISKRPHKPALSPNKALAILLEETEKGWRNPELIKQFMTFIQTNL